MKGGLETAQITSYANIRKRKIVGQLGLSLPMKQQTAIINMVISHDGARLLSYVFTATQALLCLTLSHRIDFHGCPSAYLSLF